MSRAVSDEIEQLRARALRFREEFDRGFAREPAGAGERGEDLLLVAAGADELAFRAIEVAGVFVDRVISPLPSDARGLRGVAAERGSIVPVFELARLLGLVVDRARTEPPRWLIVSKQAPLFGLAFDRLIAHARVSQHQIVASQEAAARAVVQLPDGARPLLAMEAVRGLINSAAGDPLERNA